MFTDVNYKFVYDNKENILNLFRRQSLILKSYFKVFSPDEEITATSAEFRFLQYTAGYWDLPKLDHIKIIETEFIFMGPCLPAETTKQGYKFKEDTKSLEIYKALKNKT